MVARRTAKRPGPKPLPEEERLSHCLLVRFTPGQIRDLERVAGHEPLASWIRRAVVRAIRAQQRKGEQR